MKPERFEDIVDAIALYRPGPMENIPAYLKGRENKDSILDFIQGIDYTESRNWWYYLILFFTF